MRPSSPGLAAGGAVLIALGASVASAQPPPGVSYARFDPHVIRHDRVDPVRFEVKVTGAPTAVLLAHTGGASYTLLDDGTGGDSVPGDLVYTATLPAAQVAGLLQPSDVFRPFVGFLDLYEGAIRTSRRNVFAEIVTDAVPRLPVTALAPDAQHTDYVLNLHDAAAFSDFNYARLIGRFQGLFPDDFDFINLVFEGSRFENRFHAAVKNDVLGIGQPIFGGTGRLQGFNVFPIGGIFDGAEPGYQHEIGHQWVNFLNVGPLGAGRPHWPLSSLAHGIMGWSTPGGQGLQYNCRLMEEPGGIRLVPDTAPKTFRDLDLYLMGLAPADEVGTHLVFVNQSSVPPCSSQLIPAGDVTPVTIADIVAAVGPRVPDVTTSQKDFRIATVVVSRDELLDADALALYSHFAARAEETAPVPYASGFAKGTAYPFAVSTGGRGTLDAALFPDLILADDFEGAPLVKWSSSNTDGGDLGVGVEAALDGAMGLSAHVDDTAPLYVEDDTPAHETRYRMRFRFDPNGFDTGVANGRRRVRMFIAFQDGPTRVVTVVLRLLDGQYSLRARARLDDGTRADTPFVPISDGPHAVQVAWQRATAPGSGDGRLQLWVDDAESAVLPGLDNDTAAIDFVRLGMLAVKEGAAGTTFFDTFESRRRRYIAP